MQTRPNPYLGLLGAGKRCFAGGTIPAGLKLVESTVSSAGVSIAIYERAGEIDLGSLAFGE